MDSKTTSSTRHTCLKLEIPEEEGPVFVKGTWFDTYFHLSITDGLHAWLCLATEEEVRARAEQWDQPVPEYLQLAETHLGFQQPSSTYRFFLTNDGFKRLSWTFEKDGIKLEWRWKCQPSPDSKKATSGILDFLMDANVRLSEEVVKKTNSHERLKEEADKCLAQSERFSHEKMEFESAIYSKFLAVLNSKKRKLRELRDQLSKKEAGKVGGEDDESTDKTESYDEESDHAKSEELDSKELTETSKDVPSSSNRGRGRKKVTHE